MRYKLHLYLFGESKNEPHKTTRKFRIDTLRYGFFTKKNIMKQKKARISPGSLFIRILIP